MKPLPDDPMLQHTRFIDALCADWAEAGKITLDTPRANAVLEIARQQRIETPELITERPRKLQGDPPCGVCGERVFWCDCGGPIE